MPIFFCSLACVQWKTLQAFGMLRAVVGESPFADFPITGNIAASVGDMELVKESVGNKFSECPI